MGNPTVRGLIVFVSVLVTIAFWVPLRNSPRIGPEGSTITDTYFGLFRYGTMHATMKEPHFSLDWTLHPTGLMVTIAATLVLWIGILTLLRRTRPKVSATSANQ